MKWLGVVFLSCVVAACGGGPTEPSPGDTTIGGRVVDFQTQAGVSGAALRFQDERQGLDIGALTDANGSYSLPASTSGTFTVSVNGDPQAFVHVNGSRFVGDLLVDRGTCIARYGVILDGRTARPVPGATLTVSFAGLTTTTDGRGWYRVDFGCPASGVVGFNTTLMTVTRAGYATREIVVGRGVASVIRIDLDLEPQ
jgi:hypothetical protein